MLESAGSSTEPREPAITRENVTAKPIDAHEPWMTGRLVYPDVWWQLDLVGLRDPLLRQLEDG